MSDPIIRYLSNSAHRILILANPAAGAESGQPAVAELARQLGDRGFEVQMISDLDQVTEAVGDPSKNHIRAVVAAGGDGTIAAAVNRTPPETPLTILPLGTENLLAKYLDIAPDPAKICQTIAHGATVALDAAQANDRIFLLMAGLGFDGEVVRQLDKGRKGHIRHWSYFKPILDSIRRYQYPQLRVYCQAKGAGADRGETARSGETADGAVTEARGASPCFVARWLFVTNLPCYAGGLNFVPHAVGTDGYLDLCAFERGSFWSGLRYLSGVIRGSHVNWPDCTIAQTQQLRIESDDEVPYQLDGDPGGTLPLNITVVPGRMRLLVNESWAVFHGFRHQGGVSG